MRFEPSEEAMYRRMDQKERILYLIAACGLIGSFVFLLGVINQNWYVAGGAVCFAVCFIAVMVWRYRALGQRIMPLTGCFLEVRQDCLLVRQPQRQGCQQRGRRSDGAAGLLASGGPVAGHRRPDRRDLGGAEPDDPPGGMTGPWTRGRFSGPAPDSRGETSG